VRDETRDAVGCDGQGVKLMTTLNQTAAKTQTNLMSIVFVALIGAMLVFAAGFAQSQTLHDAAHDMRHSTGFPCH
jgi:cobalt transporter subunit CbtB